MLKLAGIPEIGAGAVAAESIWPLDFHVALTTVAFSAVTIRYFGLFRLVRLAHAVLRQLAVRRVGRSNWSEQRREGAAP
jgi:hypothetical protein